MTRLAEERSMLKKRPINNNWDRSNWIKLIKCSMTIKIWLKLCTAKCSSVMSMLNKKSRETPRSVDKSSKERSRINGKSSRDKRCWNTMRDSERSLRRNTIRKWGTLRVLMSSLMISNLTSSKRWRRSNWRVNSSRSKSKKSSKEKECEMLKDWRELPRPERSSRRPTKICWKSKLKLPLKKRKKKEESRSMQPSSKLSNTWRNPRKKSDLDKNKQSDKHWLTDKSLIWWESETSRKKSSTNKLLKLKTRQQLYSKKRSEEDKKWSTPLRRAEPTRSIERTPS